MAKEMANFRPIATYKEDPGSFPNDLVLLLVKHKVPEDAECGAVADVAEGELYVTMGCLYPKEEQHWDAHWVAVGWNWENDYFTEIKDVEPVGWQPMPKAQM
jgi:hypothetical protein